MPGSSSTATPAVLSSSTGRTPTSVTLSTPHTATGGTVLSSTGGHGPSTSSALQQSSTDRPAPGFTAPVERADGPGGGPLPPPPPGPPHRPHTTEAPVSIVITIETESGDVTITMPTGERQVVAPVDAWLLPEEDDE